MNTMARLAALALACTLPAAGCSLMDAPQAATATPTPGAACAALDRLDRDDTPTAYELTVLIDTSASMLDARTGQAADWYTAIFGGHGVPQANGAVGFGAREGSLIPVLPTPAIIRVGTFDGGRRVVWRGKPIHLPRMTGGERNRAEFAAGTGRCLRERIGTAVRSPSAEPGSNVMAAFQAGGPGSGAAGRTLVLATDGLATTGCADLRHTAMRAAAHADRIVQACRAQQAIPDLTGWKVLLPWIGGTGSGHPQPQEPHLRWLHTVWTGICEQATGSARNCVVEAKPRPAPLADVPPAVQGAEDSVIEFRNVEWAPDPVRVETLPSDLLFATDSDRLSARGRQAVGAFAKAVLTEAPEWIEVAGHTDDRGDTGYNDDLSRRRAGAVRQALRAYGLDDIRIAGRGERAPKCSGRSEADRACNRRVEIRYKVRG
ncbi:OmpA family protein [Spongiactinospora sp. 9N601]|uniref:OmpA family protein n=1 Tax=Spongiactinospora sp. 9N601 TaxID=3375149 RepID=UPI00378FE406